MDLFIFFLKLGVWNFIHTMFVGLTFMVLAVPLLPLAKSKGKNQTIILTWIIGIVFGLALILLPMIGTVGCHLALQNESRLDFFWWASTYIFCLSPLGLSKIKDEDRPRPEVINAIFLSLLAVTVIGTFFVYPLPRWLWKIAWWIGK